MAVDIAELSAVPGQAMLRTQISNRSNQHAGVGDCAFEVWRQGPFGSRA
jgi:hypothetical protein